MVANCANPACGRPFRELNRGRLFLLPPTHDYSVPALLRRERLSDYCYWLCPDCERTHTINRCGPGASVMVSLRRPVQSLGEVLQSAAHRGGAG